MNELTQSSSYWDGPEMRAQNMLGIWFAASHQPWTTLTTILLELSARREWQDLLRREMEEHASLQDFKTLDRLPFLDSFIKEVVRLNPGDQFGIRRKAVHGYNFSDGSLSVPQGTTLAVPSYKMLRDPAKYANPNEIDGSQFVPTDASDQKSRFTAISYDFLTWGYRLLAYPGRFHAAFVTKLVVS
ncbi:cytochrome P450 [Lophiostoma macrostomum CBS 122681]|uniref:Cytochrome P450 n=1 Tax=Lophiostoma macrostomum CBS 122681 TaxID=1314788 RepID=A0A6A6SP70_9PLEO|nr:cytochrome P450 [Lophiostoma macrostomum CBS 122681]